MTDTQAQIAIDNDGHFYELNEETGMARRMGGWGKYPLAHKDGIKLMCLWLQYDKQWDELTRAQQRCVLQPETATTRPWAALVEKGYGAPVIGELTESGRFLARFVTKVKHR